MLRLVLIELCVIDLLFLYSDSVSVLFRENYTNTYIITCICFTVSVFSDNLDIAQVIYYVCDDMCNGWYSVYSRYIYTYVRTYIC